MKRDTIGTKPNAKQVGMAVFKQSNEAYLSLMMEYRKKVPNERAMNMKASKNPRKRSPIPNLVYKLCLLKLYVILIMCTLAYVRKVRMYALVFICYLSTNFKGKILKRYWTIKFYFNEQFIWSGCLKISNLIFLKRCKNIRLYFRLRSKGVNWGK